MAVKEKKSRRKVIRKFKVRGHNVIMVGTGILLRELGMSYDSFLRMRSVRETPFYPPFKYDSGLRTYYVYPIDYVAALKYVFKEVIRYPRSKGWSFPKYTEDLIGEVNRVITNCIYQYGEVRDENDLIEIENIYPEFIASRAMDYIVELKQIYEEGYV